MGAPEDIYSVTEVSNSTLEFDRTAKLDLYAAAGIPEYWLANVNSKQLEVHCDSKGNLCGTRLIFLEGETVACLAFPEVVLEWNNNCKKYSDSSTSMGNR